MADAESDDDQDDDLVELASTSDIDEKPGENDKDRKNKEEKTVSRKIFSFDVSQFLVRGNFTLIKLDVIIKFGS